MDRGNRRQGVAMADFPLDCVEASEIGEGLRPGQTSS
jgi:hypothetical protein